MAAGERLSKNVVLRKTCLGDRSITSEDVIETSANLFAAQGVPKRIGSDNGPEFVTHAI